MESLHVEITGRVQGVGFRWFAKERARALRLSGWVKNRSDGNVEVAAAGNPDALQQFRAALAEGPHGATVQNVNELERIDASELDQPFAIVR